METIFSIDFKKISKSDAYVPVMDRGFLYGESVYEAIRTYHNKLFLLDEHYERLRNSASRLSMPVPFSVDKLRKHLLELVKKSDRDCYIRVIVTRGEDDVFDLFPKKASNPRTIIVIRKIHSYPKEFYSKGIKLAIVSVRRNPKTSLDPEIKSGNYLNNVLAIMEARAKGADDALMINANGNVTECTTSNVFIAKDGVVLTPKLEAGILHGVTRQFLINIMKKKNLSFEEANLTPKDVYESDECFITATTKEIMPVRMCGDKMIGDGKVGNITLKLMKLFREEVLRIIGIS